MKKTQKELGAVHLRIDGLDKERFKKLIEGHVIASGGIEYYLNSKECYIENWSHDVFKWICATNTSSKSRLITLDELEQLLKSTRTIEDVETDILKLQEELKELRSIKVGDVVVAKNGLIGMVNDKVHGLSKLGNVLYQDCVKIDPNKTVKEILGL